MGKIKESLKSFFGKKEDKKEIERDVYSVSEHEEDLWTELGNHSAITERKNKIDRTIAELETQEERRLQQEKIQEERLRQNEEFIQKQIQATEAKQDGKVDVGKDVKTDKFGYRTTKSIDEIEFEQAIAELHRLNDKYRDDSRNGGNDSKDDEYDEYAEL